MLVLRSNIRQYLSLSSLVGRLIPVLAALALLLPSACLAQPFDQITVTRPTPLVTSWRIDSPTVNAPKTDYFGIPLNPWDLVQISGGGCVQTGGKGKTWKSYLYPQGDKSDRLYHGEIQLPGITNGLDWTSHYVNQPIQLPGTVPPGSHLILGYTDDGYSDNSYQSHDNGDNNQCLNVGNAFLIVTVTKQTGSITQPVVQVRIAGIKHLDLDRKDGGDGAALIGMGAYTCVTHNPGCGTKGNNGTDKFFAADKPLPPGATIVEPDFTAGYPSHNGTDGYGSYGTVLRSDLTDSTQPYLSAVDWHNACVGPLGGKNAYYLMSFVVSAPQGMDLGEPSFPVSTPPPAGCALPPPAPPAGSGATMTGATMALSGWSGVVVVCNNSTAPITGTLVLNAAIAGSSSTTGTGTGMTGMTGMSTGSTASPPKSMAENISLTIPASPGSPVSVPFQTASAYQEGTWNITSAQVKGVTGTLTKNPGPTAIPTIAGHPILDFTLSNCNPD